MDRCSIMTCWLSLAVMLMAGSNLVAQEQAQTDQTPDAPVETVVVEEASTTSDPTQASSSLLEAMLEQPGTSTGIRQHTPKLPAIQLRARVIVKNKPPLVVLQVGTKYYQGRPGASIFVDAGPNTMEIQIKSVSADEVRIDLPDLKKTLSLN